MKYVIVAALCLSALGLAGCQRGEDKPADETAVASEAPGGSGAAGSYAPPQMNAGPPRDGPATLEFAGSVSPGAQFDVRWTGPANTGDYIDIVQRGDTRTAGEITYMYVRDTSPTGVQVRAPTKPGDYDVRYVVQLEGSRKIAATVPLTLTAAAATLQAPADALGGATVEVAWTGPSGEGDYIDIMPANSSETSGEISYAYTRDGSPARLTAPGPAGAYEIRYILEGPGGRQILARAPLAVTLPTATLEAQTDARRGELVSVKWTGPNNEGDYVDIVPKGYGATSGEIGYFYTRGGSPRELNAPANAGDYEICYVMEAPKGRLILARSPLKVG